MNYDVTIGIPVFEAEKYLSRSLESALAQSYSSVEFLLVDDGSIDGSVSIMQDYQKNHPRGVDIHIISHDHNMGVSAARNHIIEEASGFYLYFLDADDVIAENTIALMMDNIRQYEAEIVFGSYEKISTDGIREVYLYPKLQLSGEDELASFAYQKYAGIQASACNYLVQTSLLRGHHHHFIDTDYWEDFVFTFDLVTMVTRAVLLPDITYTYLCRDNSLSHYQQRTQIPKEEILRNVRTVAHLRDTSSLLYNKVYYPNRCYLIVMTGFYVACNVLKRRQDIVPSISDMEIKDMITHPATFGQICRFHQSRLKNLSLYLLGRLPAGVCVMIVRSIGKIKKLI
jgi:glycosyltransferase involved in cell wall biosynthesis